MNYLKKMQKAMDLYAQHNTEDPPCSCTGCTEINAIMSMFPHRLKLYCTLCGCQRKVSACPQCGVQSKVFAVTAKDLKKVRVNTV